jgi:hypothetical protein
MNNSNPSLIPITAGQPLSRLRGDYAGAQDVSRCGSVALLNVARALSGPGYGGIARLNSTAIADVPRKYYPQRANFMHST